MSLTLLSARRDIAGVDGCRRGWVVASTNADETSEIAVEVIPSLTVLEERLRAGSLVGVGIDIPMGLPDHGARACDVEARRYLGHRRSSVFPAPIRALLELPEIADYRAARERSLAAHGKSLSIQAFNLLPKIRDADALARGEFGEDLVEVHPETAFAVMNGGIPLTKSKKTAAGREERWRLLSHEFSSLVGREILRLPGASGDDILDAIAALWSTRRWYAGIAIVFGDCQLDSTGRRMQIVA